MNEDEFREQRRRGIGASDVPAIMGVSPYGSPWATWAQKVRLTAGPDETAAMTFGRDLEPVIGAWFERETGLFVVGEQTMCTHPDETLARATVDGFVADGDPDDPMSETLGVFEAKFSGQAIGDTIPDHYLYQVQWQMYVTGLDRGWVAVMSLAFGRPTFHVYAVDRDDDLIGRCVDACRTFWTDHVLTGTPPPVDASRATSEAISAAYRHDDPAEPAVDLDDIAHLINRWRRAKDNAKQVQESVDELENTIKVRLGTATAGQVDGETVVTWREQSAKRLDPAKVFSLLERFNLPTDTVQTVRSFRVLRAKKAS